MKATMNYFWYDTVTVSYKKGHLISLFLHVQYNSEHSSDYYMYMYVSSITVYIYNAPSASNFLVKNGTMQTIAIDWIYYAVFVCLLSKSLNGWFGICPGMGHKQRTLSLKIEDV